MNLFVERHYPMHKKSSNPTEDSSFLINLSHFFLFDLFVYNMAGGKLSHDIIV